MALRASVNGAPQQFGQVEATFAQLELAVGHPSSVEQVVDQPAHEHDLAIDDRPHFFAGFVQIP